jgi:hypothetical protein
MDASTRWVALLSDFGWSLLEVEPHTVNQGARRRRGGASGATAMENGGGEDKDSTVKCPSISLATVKSVSSIDNRGNKDAMTNEQKSRVTGVVQRNRLLMVFWRLPYEMEGEVFRIT